MMRFGLLLAIVSLAGCAEAPPPPAVEAPRHVGRAQGIDLPLSAAPVVNNLKGTGVDFVARYYREPTSRWPSLTADEAKQLSAAGLNLVTVWESHSHDPRYFSYSHGYYDALNAASQAKAISQPKDSAIYFAVDFDARGSDIMAAVDPYFRGIAAGLAAATGGQPPEYKVGAYGSGAVCDYLKRARLAEFTWLSNSTAWAGYSSYAGWDIKQGKASSVFSFNHDSDEARDEYGAFQLTTQYTSL